MKKYMVEVQSTIVRTDYWFIQEDNQEPLYSKALNKSKDSIGTDFGVDSVSSKVIRIKEIE
jgi:hypothetical protein